MDEQLRKIIEHTKLRNRKLEEKVRLREAAAREEANRLAARFAEVDTSVRRVVLFGSLDDGNVRSEHFDIDLAVKGGDYMNLLAEAEESTFKVDLVEMRTCSETFRRRIKERGVLLYEAGC